MGNALAVAKCPYCGGLMVRDPDYGVFPWTGSDALFGAYCHCERCGATSPHGKGHTEGEAIADAIRLAQQGPALKPLMLREAWELNDRKEPLWVESNFEGEWHGLYPIQGWIVSLGLFNPLRDPDALNFREKQYGKMWRCWPYKPSEEQRRDAPWDGDEHHEQFRGWFRGCREEE